VSTPVSAPLEATTLTDRGPTNREQPNFGKNPRQPLPPVSRRLRRWVIGIAVIALLLLIFVVIQVQGSVKGMELSPDYFQQREFHFYEIPLLHLQLTPIRRIAETSSTGLYLRQHALINAPPGGPQQWHLVTLSRGLFRTTAADAQLLGNQLQLEAGEQPYWRQWSIDHPELARVLWPKIQTLALRELYFLMPRLFELAQREQTAGELARAADNYLIAEYQSLILDMVEADRLPLAQQLRDEAKSDFPPGGKYRSIDWDALLAEATR